MALDAKRTFDALVERTAPNPQIARQIRDNPIYRELSQEVGGSIEFMAMEKLHELLASGAFDCIVVDTAPSSHARDLLGAPGRIADLAASSAVRILKSPITLLEGAGLAALPLRALLAALQRWTGLTLLDDLADFAAGFEPIAGGFGERAAAIEDTLRASGTSFVLISIPELDTAAATVALAQELREDSMPLAGVIANRVHEFPPRESIRPPRCSADLLRKLEINYADFDALARRDARATEALSERLGTPLLARIPALDDPVASLPQLRQLADLLSARLG
jgi:anion-transporting  ArsA/GET3 family ATPase